MSEQSRTHRKKGRPRLAKNWSADLLNERSREYFAKCDARTREVVTRNGEIVTVSNPAPYTIEGLCSYLDVTRNEFYAWRKRNDALGIKAQKVHNKIMDNRVTGGLDGTQNSSFAQFMLKNNAPEDYRDKMEVVSDVSERTAAMFEEWGKTWERK